MTSEEQPQGVVPGHLDLNTLVELPVIGCRIDGVEYYYSAHWRWSLMERARFGSLYSDLLGLERKENPTEKDQKRFTEIQILLCRLACPDLPEEVLLALPSDAQRSALLVDFLTKSGNQGITLIPKEHAAILSLLNTTGVRSLHDSKSPMEVIPKNGRTSRGRS